MVFSFVINKRYYRLLRIIERQSYNEEEKLRDLCSNFGYTSQSNFSRMLRTLEKDGLIYIEVYGRERRVFLTERGKKIMYYLHKAVELYEQKFNKS